jgi:hypothetical protein
MSAAGAAVGALLAAARRLDVSQVGVLLLFICRNPHMRCLVKRLNLLSWLLLLLLL